MSRIEDLSAGKASLIRELVRERKARDDEGAFVVEGAKAIQDLAERGIADIVAVVVTQRWLEQRETDLRRWSQRLQMPIYRCRESMFDRLSDVRTSQGILAVVRKPQWDPASIFARRRLFGMFGESLQDPANVGAIIRTAVAFGLDALWLSLDSVDVYNPKVVRATAGALLVLPLFFVEEAPRLFAQHDCQLLASETPGAASVPIQQIIALPPRAILAMGNESRGLSATTLQQAQVRFHIPVSPMIESLNVAASAAIAVFYLSGLRRV